MCGGVVTDFRGFDKLPPGDHILHWIDYQVVMPPGESSDLEFNSAFPCTGTNPAANVVVIAGVSIPPVTFGTTIYSIAPSSEYRFDFNVGSAGEVYVPVGASSFSTTVSLQQTAGPPAEVIGFALAFYDSDPSPANNWPFQPIAVEPIGVLAALSGGLEYLNVNYAAYPDENSPLFFIHATIDSTPPFPTSVQFLAREEILRVDFVVTTPVLVPATYFLDCAGPLTEASVRIEGGPNGQLISFGCFFGPEAAGAFDVIFYQPPVPEFRRGDCNTDGTFDIADTISGLSFLFAGGLPSACAATCDTNDDGNLDIGDPISGLTVLFAGGLPLPSPGPFVCGPDPTPGGADCLAYICP